jgi:hypothetical protein
MKQTIKTLAIGAAATAAFGMTAHAQSADALIDKLVDKGILTVKEANDLRDESDKGFTTAFATKTGMPDWVTALKFSGDVRGRYEGFYANIAGTDQNGNALWVNRDRLRYRVRFGVTATLMDDFEAGLKLTSDEPNGSFGGDPISGNQTFTDNGSKKSIYIDQAFGKWTPLKGPNLTGGIIVGKMENPLVIDDMVFDPDYTPEGVAAQFAYRLNDKHSLKVNGGWFILDENSSSLQDPNMYAAQVRWDAVWNAKLNTTLGFTALGINSAGNLINGNVPNVNRGNARNTAGQLTYAHNPFVVDGAATYSLDSFPFYTGAFPIKFSGEYMQNPSAPGSADNFAWNTGVTFGKAGKRHTWELGYTYKWLGADSWFEEVVDSDFGAYYGNAFPLTTGSPPNSGSSYGYGAGTNVKGHILKFAYSPSDSFVFSVKWFITDLINQYPVGSPSRMDRLQVDGMWKF